jgi:hypothetical protein
VFSARGKRGRSETSYTPKNPEQRREEISEERGRREGVGRGEGKGGERGGGVSRGKEGEGATGKAVQLPNFNSI